MDSNECIQCFLFWVKYHYSFNLHFKVRQHEQITTAFCERLFSDCSIFAHTKQTLCWWVFPLCGSLVCCFSNWIVLLRRLFVLQRTVKKNVSVDDKNVDLLIQSKLNFNWFDNSLKNNNKTITKISFKIFPI